MSERKSVKRAAVFYFSATGNTRKIALWIAEELRAEGWDVELFNIELIQKNLKAMPEPGNFALVFIGYPVFAWREPFNVRKFIKREIKNKNLNVVQFLTYGGILGNSIFKVWFNLSRGNRYFGKIHIRAEDSHPVLRRKWTMPFIKEGAPSEKDREILRKKLQRVLENFERGRTVFEIPHPLAFLLDILSVFYSRGWVDFWFKKWVDVEKCTSCGLCWDYCPMSVIEPVEKNKKLVPHFLRGCIGCYRCVNICPVNALNSYFTKKGLRYRPRGIYEDYR